MPRYVLELPRSWDEKLAAIAAAEGVPPRTLLYWLLAKGIKRTDAAEVKRRIAASKAA